MELNFDAAGAKRHMPEVVSSCADGEPQHVVSLAAVPPECAKIDAIRHQWIGETD
ncbi:hypothetical protein [Sagittula stellata]|uniref:hypothetical protein n=1 Tax=Sagittula stellata TaxID=52603 RepID=UPI000301CFB4|nr:hypothetical protein [Sagittula stellata]